MRSKVVLPQPDGPSRQTKLPRATLRATLSTAVKAPKRLDSPSISRPDIWPDSCPNSCSHTVQVAISSVHFWFSQSALVWYRS